MSPPSLGRFDVEDGVKLVAIVTISDFTKDYLIMQIQFLIIYKYDNHWTSNRRSFVNALAFSGSKFSFSSFSEESIDKERKRHDEAIEDLQRAPIEWSKKRQERLDYINIKIFKE